MIDLTLLNFGLNLFASVILPLLLVTGWVVTRRHLEDQAKQYRETIEQLKEELKRNREGHEEEVIRIMASNAAIAEQTQLAYARMVVAKDDQIARLEAYLKDFQAIALGSLTGLKTTANSAVTVAEAAVEKLGS